MEEEITVCLCCTNRFKVKERKEGWRLEINFPKEEQTIVCQDSNEKKEREKVVQKKQTKKIIQ